MINRKPSYNNRKLHSIRYVTALITMIVGVADMLSAIVPRLNWTILLGAWPITSLHGRLHAQTFVVVVGFFLIVLSYGLARGKKHAWRITLVLLLLSAILHVQRSGSVLATVVALLLAGAMYALARFFRAKSDPPAARRGYIALLLGLSIVIFYIIGGFIVLHDDFAPFFDRFSIDGVLLNLLTFTHMRSLSHYTQAFFFGRALPLLCISAIVYGMVQIFRPVAAALLPKTEECQKVANLLHFYGKNSISYFALSEDKLYFFSSSGKSVISYILQGSTAVVAGDPIGPEDEISSVLRQFVDFCREQDWSIVFWQVRSELADLYRQIGLRLLKIGEDAVINIQAFSLKGGAMANVRASAKRAEKEGLHVVIYKGRVTDTGQLAQMGQISRAWLMSKRGSEMEFSMGSFDPRGDSEQLYALAIDGTDKVHAFVSFVPIYGRCGWGLDLMRRTQDCAPGAMELLLARSFEYMKSTGTEVASLGLAPLSNVNCECETFLDSSLTTLTTRFGNPAKNRSLFNFKKKFQPLWESRYLVYSDTLNLPKAGWALYHAHQKDVSLLGMLRSWRSNGHERQASLEALKA